MGKRILHIGMDGMNLLFVKKFAAEGVLPTFQRMMERGTFNRLLPSIPAWTPTNWAAQVTGADPGTHGLGGWERRRKTQPWDAPRIQSWEFVDWRAETIWEVAEEAGLKSMITFFPVATWPSPVKEGFVVAPGFRDPPLVIADRMEYFCRLAAEKAAVERATTVAERGMRTVDLAEEGAPPGSAILRLGPAEGWRNAPAGAWAGELPIPLTEGAGTSTLQLLVTRSSSGRPARFLVCEGKDARKPLAEMELGKWTPFTIRSFGEGAKAREGGVRFRLLEVSPEGSSFHFCRSQIYPTHGFTYPTSLSEELVENVGPFIQRYSVMPRGDPELDTFMDDQLYQGLWEARAARYVLEKYGWDLHFCHWHLFDNINHPTINLADPAGPDYDPQVGEWNIEAQRRAYQVGDEVLAEFLKAADEDTYVLVISDHAMAPAHRWCDVDVLLAEKGLTAFKGPSREIDLARSRAYTLPTRGAEIFVNLKGREPFGIVPPEEYEAVQEEVIDALLTWRDPATGKRPIALALKLQDAQIIGFWGEEQGDVIFTYNRGFGWGAVYERGAGGEPTGGRQSIGPGRGAIHGSQIPTSEKGVLSNMGALVLAGPGIKAGYERDWQRYGLMREVDIAPTISHILGLRPPAHSRGAILHDIFE